MRIFAAILCAVIACPVWADDAAVRSAARTILTSLQEVSVRNNREYCGVILRRADGSLVSSNAFGGSATRCQVREIPVEGEVVASYHTHGAYLPDYDNEVPSVLDLQVEMEWGIDGYVATPGGRFWHVDGRNGVVNLICGPGCLPRDARYADQVREFGKIRQSYTMDQLILRARMQDF